MTTEYTQWRSMVDEQAYPAIPDSVLCRDSDTDTATTSSDRGFEFEVKSNFNEVGYRISENSTIGTGTALLYEDDSGEGGDSDNYKQVESLDISDLGSNDEFSIEYDYDTDAIYVVEVTHDGTDYGWESDTELPIENDDIKMTSPTRDGGDPADRNNQISCIGDLAID